MGKMLLSHLHGDNASKLGINIQATVGAESQHTLHLIMDAPDSQKVDEFMAMFTQMGSVEVIPGITCDAIEPGVIVQPVTIGAFYPVG